MSRGYTVYRVDYVTGKKEAIGCILERRAGTRDRGGNLLALLVEARRLFGRGSGDAFRIVLDSPRNSRDLSAQEMEGKPDLVDAGGHPNF